MLGVIILSGGEGSRCGANGAKGMISLAGKTLFEWIFEKIDAQVPVAVLTSSKNHATIAHFFQEHHHFGIKDLSFCSQGTLPLLDDFGNPVVDSAGAVVEGSDGNGSLFEVFASSGILSHWECLGVERVHIVPVDNPIVDPLDPILDQDADLTLLSIPVLYPEEPVGRCVFSEGRVSIVEYSELTPEARTRELRANAGLYGCSLSFLRTLSSQSFPLHYVRRSSAWKREKFIVDALSFAQNICVVPVPRAHYYLALKDRESIPEIQRILLDKNPLGLPRGWPLGRRV